MVFSAIGIRQFGRFSFGSLDDFHSAVWTAYDLLTFRVRPKTAALSFAGSKSKRQLRRPLGAANPPCQSTTPQMKPIQIRSGSLLGPLTPTHGRKRHNARTPCKMAFSRDSKNFSDAHDNLQKHRLPAPKPPPQLRCLPIPILPYRHQIPPIFKSEWLIFLYDTVGKWLIFLLYPW